jgi:hypothetical protein
MLIGCSGATFIGGFAVAMLGIFVTRLILVTLSESVSRDGPIDHARIQVGLFDFGPPKERLLSHAHHPC